MPRPEAASSKTEIADEQQLEQMRELLDQFAREKQELIAAIKTSDIKEQDIQGLMELLSQPKLGDLTSTARLPEPVTLPRPSDPGGAGSGRYADIKPDRKLVQEIEDDLTLAFDDLSSPDAELQAKAALRCLEEDNSIHKEQLRLFVQYENWKDDPERLDKKMGDWTIDKETVMSWKEVL